MSTRMQDRKRIQKQLLQGGIIGLVGVCVFAAILQAATPFLAEGTIGGGGRSSGGNYALQQVIAEPVIGDMAGGALSLCSGYQCALMQRSTPSTATRTPDPSQPPGGSITPTTTPDPNETPEMTPTNHIPNGTATLTPTIDPVATDPAATATPPATSTPSESGTARGEKIYLPVILR